MSVASWSACLIAASSFAGAAVVSVISLTDASTAVAAVLASPAALPASAAALASCGDGVLSGGAGGAGAGSADAALGGASTSRDSSPSDLLRTTGSACWTSGLYSWIAIALSLGTMWAIASTPARRTSWSTSSTTRRSSGAASAGGSSAIAGIAASRTLTSGESIMSAGDGAVPGGF